MNTTDSAVRLTHLPTGIVVACQRERSQLLNKRICLERLRAKIAEAMAPPPPPRKKSRPSRAAKERRLAQKSQRAGIKAARRKPASED